MSFRYTTFLLYSTKGTEASGLVQGLAARLVLKQSYLEIPVLGKLIIPVEGSDVRPVFLAGPAISFELSCKLEGRISTVSQELACDDSSIQFLTKSADIGFILGGAVEFKLGSGWLSLGARYNLGLSDINDIPASPVDIKNRVFSLLVGYSFRLPSGRADLLP